MGAEMYSQKSDSIITNDDVAVEDSTFTTGRRGVAATVLVEKIVGSLAEDRGSLEDCKKIGDKVNKNAGTMGVAFTSCTTPEAGKPTFDIGFDEMEFGVGIHGEPGRKREKIQSSKKIVGNILDAILDDLKPENNEKILLFVNGMGGTPLTELYLVYDDACKILQSKGFEVTRSLVGNYCTSLEMQGASITLLKCDEEILKNWDAPVHTAAMRWGM
jgi:dihydroxyacetone kinase-like protein